MTTPIVRIVDDDCALAEGLAYLLEGEGWQVNVYDSAQRFLSEDLPSVPGCLVLDVRMPGMTGLELQRVMRERHYNLPIIFLTGHGDIEMAVATMKLGAVEFLQKSGNNTQLLNAVARAVSRSLSGWVDMEADAFEANRRWESLTEREQEITHLLAKGLRNREVGERLGVSVRTIEVHRARIFKKLGIKSVAELTTLLAKQTPEDEG